MIFHAIPVLSLVNAIMSTGNKGMCHHCLAFTYTFYITVIRVLRKEVGAEHKQGRNLEAGIDREDVEWHRVLFCPTWLMQPAFL